MKTNKLFKSHHSLVRLLYHPHFQGAVIITVIILLLLLAGCSSYNQPRFYSKANNDCDRLLKKRFSNGRPGRQPKIKSVSPQDKKTVSLAKIENGTGYYSLNDSLVHSEPASAASTFQLSQDSGFFNDVHPGNVSISKKSPGLFQRATEIKSIDELPGPAQPFSKESDYGSSLVHYGLMLGGPLVVSLLFLSAFTQTSMRVSAWGTHHPMASKMILGGVHVGTGLTGLAVGNYLGGQQFLIPEEVIASTSGVFIATSILYPTSQKLLGRFSSSYRRQKFCDVLLYLTGISMFLSAGNHLSQPEKSISPQIFQGITDYRPINAYVSSREIEGSKDLRSDQVEKKNGKITLTILASLFFTAGVLLVAGVSCSLSCSGAGTGAVLVALLGGTGFILAYVAMLKNINKKYKVKRKHPKESVIPAS